MTPAQHLARRHPRAFGCVSLAVITSGDWNEKALRREVAEDVVAMFGGVDDVQTRKPEVVDELCEAAPDLPPVLTEAQRLGALVADLKRHVALMSKGRVLPFFPPRPAEHVAVPGVWRNWQGAADMDIPEVRSAWKAAMTATVKARDRPFQRQRAARIGRELARAERLALFAGRAAAADGRAYRAYLAERGEFQDAVQDGACNQDPETRCGLAMQRGDAFKPIRRDQDEAVRKAAADHPALKNAERFRTVPDALDLRAMGCVPPTTHAGTGALH